MCQRLRLAKDLLAEDGVIFVSIDDNELFNLGLAAARRVPELRADCRCHFCDESVPAPVLFCDADCRDDDEREKICS
jgi:hypothetical protein